MVNATFVAELSNKIESAAGIDQEEVDQILTALRRLKEQVTSPVVKECLEAARCDIVHLTVTEVMPEDEEYEEDDDLDYEE